MRIQVGITGVVTDAKTIDQIIKNKLAEIGMMEIVINTLPHFDDWLAGLSKLKLSGLSSACLDWVRNWGNGGGDQSSETCITDAINNCGSDIPAVLAEAIFNSVSGYSKSKFDAAGLTIEIIDGCIEECKATIREAEQQL
ncbi:MAG: hypothetical protein FWE27_08925 [Defluviitaleaceae bacterium]|nr:hypothetical protein [Defluviitaleaceae bacterium]